MSYCSYYCRSFWKIYPLIHNIFSDPTFSLPFIEGSAFLQRNGTKYTLQACINKRWIYQTARSMLLLWYCQTKSLVYVAPPLPCALHMKGSWKRPTILDSIFRDGFHKKVDIETTPQDLVGHHSTSCVLSYSILSMANLEGKLSIICHFENLLWPVKVSKGLQGHLSLNNITI